MSEFHEALFRWPHPDASNVIVTGSFDSWSGSIHLSRTGSGFEGRANVPWGEKVPYKYIVDGRWTTTDDQPTEYDSIGNLNNVYRSPARPAVVPETSISIAGTVAGAIQTAKEAAMDMVEAIAPGTTCQAPSPPAEAESEAGTAVDPQPKYPPPREGPPAPAPTEPETVGKITSEVVLPSEAESAPVLPIVPIHMVPLEPPANGTPADATIVEDAKAADAAPTAASTPEAQPSTHTPAGANGVDTTAINSPAKEASEAAPVTPLINGGSQPTTPALNGTGSAPTTPAMNGNALSATTSTASSPSTPAKERRMRFPSLSSHSHRSSSASLSEFGESQSSTSNGKPDTHASRLGSSRKQRNSIFGRLKEMFHHEGSPGK
ncbi:hypothetical protein AcW1_004222 [Taiwanofungus camphoratus]|nr:hypothetical protein AcW1_004222 [Antrodia cinnamomea]KAI0959385.1 hypothetical protein AcW1_004222 [Antrodia cinnamomea]